MLNAWHATECHSEAGTSGSLIADVKTLVSETIPRVDTSTVWLVTDLLPAKQVKRQENVWFKLHDR